MGVTAGASGTAKRSQTGLWVVAICFAAIIFDGYDLIVYGAIVPSLLEHPGWHLSPARAGAIGSYALIGMLIGTLVVGALTDVLGRRKIMLGSIAWFSLAMGGCALAPTPEALGLLRFVAGLGLGGVVPTAIALTVEYSPAHRRHLNNALMYSGYSVGGILAAVLAINLLPDYGFRTMLWIGMAPLVLVLPLAWKFLPESVRFLLARGRRAEAERLADRYGISISDIEDDAVPQPAAGSGQQASRWSGLTLLFRREYITATVLFGVASFFGLLLVYGLNTWLPQIMRKAGYPLGSSLQFLLVLNLGAILGTVLMSTLADRFGSKPITATAFVAAAVSIFALSVRLPALALFAFVAVAGLGTVGTQILVNGYVATHYPAYSRATALGWSLGVGRLGAVIGPLFGGWVLTSGLAFQWNFYGFAIPAVFGALVILAVPAAVRARSVSRGREPQTSTAGV